MKYSTSTYIFRALLLSSFFLTSCTKMILGIYGMSDEPKSLEDTQIVEYANKFDLPIKDCYVLDTSYFDYMYSFDTTKYRQEVSNNLQPLRAYYYDTSGYPVSFQINCYTGGFPNLKWNRNDNMMSFPPKRQAPIDSLLPLDMSLKFLTPLTNTKIDKGNYDYYIIVFWTHFLGRQNKRYLRYIQQNKELAKNSSVKIIYVNTDNFYVRKFE